MLSATEENYMKAIYKLAEKLEDDSFVNTNAIAQRMNTRAASVTDMIKRLSEKDYVSYTRYKGVKLTDKGRQNATSLIRKHRLWEVFLLEKLNFKWDEVHEIAEQLEHIQSKELTLRLEAFLDFPTVDPHGDPIPDKNGKLPFYELKTLAELNIGDSAEIVGVKEHSPEFLRYLDEEHLVLGSKLEVIQIFEYDSSVKVKLRKLDQNTTVSQNVANNLTIRSL